MQSFWLGLAIVGAAAYHVVLKLTPTGVNPYLSLAVTYAVVTLVFAAAYLALPGAVAMRVAIGQLNWTALLLLLVGFVFFSEKIDLPKVTGILLCVAGLWLISRK